MLDQRDIAMRNTLKVFFMMFFVWGCGEDAVKTALDGGPSADTADKIEFVSDVSWLKDVAGKLDQASLPWVMGAFILSKDVEGVSVPVLFDAEGETAITADIKIEVAGSAALGDRPKLKIYEKTAVPLKPLGLTAVLSSGDDSASFDRIPESVPLVGGKTIKPLYFMIPMTEFDWTTAGDETKKNFEDAFNNGNLGTLTENGGKDLPLPWTDCEPTKITVTFNKDATTGEEPKTIVAEKYLAADPAATLQLIDALASTAGPIIKENTGFDVTKIKEALPSGTTACAAVTDEQKAKFAE